MRIAFLVMAALSLSLAACQHELDRTLEIETVRRNAQAKSMLAATDFASARDEYAAVLEADPENAEAAFGWVIADVFLLPDSKPVADFLDRVNQPRFNVGRDVFGSDGLLARTEAANQGLAELTVHHRNAAGEAYVDLEFAPKTVKSEIERVQPPNDGPAYNEIRISIREQSTAEPRWLTILLRPDDLLSGDEQITPLADGVVISELSRLAGEVSFSVPARDSDFEVRYIGSSPASGSIKFLRGGKKADDPLELELIDVVIPAACGDPRCTAAYVLRGRISDTINAPIRLEGDALPFGGVEGEDGPPRKNGLVVALERASPIDTAFLAAQARALGDQLAAQSARLDVVLRSAEPDRFAFSLPRAMLRTETDLPINATDVRTLKALIDLVSAGLELVAQYRYIDGPLQALLRDYRRWASVFDPGLPDTGTGGTTGTGGGGSTPEPVEELVRDFDPELLAANLAMTFLLRESGFDLESRLRPRIESGLVAAVSALRGEPEASGLVDFQALAARRFSRDLASALDALRQSISSPEPVALPSAPLYAVHLASFFAQPLDRDRLLALSGLATLVSLRQGDPGAPTAAGRNKEVVFEIDPEKLAKHPEWLGGLYRPPPDRSSIACTTSDVCGAGYSCRGERCEADPPGFASEESLEGIVREDWPVFLSPLVREVIDFGF